MPTITDAATKGEMLPAKGDRPTLQKWQVTLDDGRTAEMLRKPDSDAPTGDVTVEETQWGLRAKIVQSNGYKGGGKDFKADPAKLRSENARSALHAAKDLVVAGKIELTEMGKKTADFYSYISKHSEES
jgi:hypothetical protein